MGLDYDRSAIRGGSCAIAADFLAAYTATDFVVFDGPEQWAIHVGVASPRVDALMDRHGAACATIVTAFNPRSRVLPPEANKARHQVAGPAAGGAGLTFLLGEGR